MTDADYMALALRYAEEAFARGDWPPERIQATVEAPAAVYGPDFDDFVAITVKNWKAAGIDADLKLKEYGAFISSTIFGKFDAMFIGLRDVGRPRGVLLPLVHARPAAERLGRASTPSSST